MRSEEKREGGRGEREEEREVRRSELNKRGGVWETITNEINEMR